MEQRPYLISDNLIKTLPNVLNKQFSKEERDMGDKYSEKKMLNILNYQLY